MTDKSDENRKNSLSVLSLDELYEELESIDAQLAGLEGFGDAGKFDQVRLNKERLAITQQVKTFDNVAIASSNWKKLLSSAKEAINPEPQENETKRANSMAASTPAEPKKVKKKEDSGVEKIKRLEQRIAESESKIKSATFSRDFNKRDLGLLKAGKPESWDNKPTGKELVKRIAELEGFISESEKDIRKETEQLGKDQKSLNKLQGKSKAVARVIGRPTVKPLTQTQPSSATKSPEPEKTLSLKELNEQKDIAVERGKELNITKEAASKVADTRLSELASKKKELAQKKFFQREDKKRLKAEIATLNKDIDPLARDSIKIINELESTKAKIRELNTKIIAEKAKPSSELPPVVQPVIFTESAKKQPPSPRGKIEAYFTRRNKKPGPK